MEAYVVLDLNLKETEYDSIESLEVFINAFNSFSPYNSLYVISSLQSIYNSKSSYNFTENLKSYLDKTEYKPFCLSRDLGLCILKKPSFILIYSFSKENPSANLKYLKCLFAAQNLKVKIHAFSLYDNPTFKMLCAATGGCYFTECSPFNLLSLLGNPEITKECNRINCYCCNKPVKLSLICPICLTVYCKFCPVCKKCKTKFNFIKS